MLRLSDLVAKAIARDGEYTAEELLAECAAGRMQLWPGKDALAITQIKTRAGRKVLHVGIIAGCGEELEQMEHAVAAWGKTQGCEAMTQTGRIGWRKVLKHRGWHETAVTMERAIT